MTERPSLVRRWSGRAAGSLPGAARSMVNRLILAWGMTTARWRMSPSFLVIGAQRAGTTSLFTALSGHPDIVRPTVWKGIGYFDVNYSRGMRWYRGHFPLTFGRRDKLAFESSGYYSFHPLASDRIARDLPGVKVVMVVRNPVDRAHSAHRHEHARGFENLEFPEALKAEPDRLMGEVDRIIAEQPDYESHAHRHHAYLGRGLYAEQIERFVGVLGSDRVYVVDADRLFADPAGELSALFAWLGAVPWTPASFDQLNARPRSDLDSDVRARLLDYFAESDRRLERLMGRLPSWRS